MVITSCLEPGGAGEGVVVFGRAACICCAADRCQLGMGVCESRVRAGEIAGEKVGTATAAATRAAHDCTSICDWPPHQASRSPFTQWWQLANLPEKIENPQCHPRSKQAAATVAATPASVLPTPLPGTCAV